MTIQDLKDRHPGRVCVCRPHLRDDKSGRVVSWICLQTFASVEDAGYALERFEHQSGVEDAVLISTSGLIPIEGELAAKYYRVFRGTDQ